MGAEYAEFVKFPISNKQKKKTVESLIALMCVRVCLYGLYNACNSYGLVYQVSAFIFLLVAMCRGICRILTTGFTGGGKPYQMRCEASRTELRLNPSGIGWDSLVLGQYIRFSLKKLD